MVGGDLRSGNGDMGRVLRCFSSKMLVVFRPSLNIVFRRDIMRIKKEEHWSSNVGPRILRKLGLLWKSQGPLDLVVKVKPSPSRALSCREFCCRECGYTLGSNLLLLLWAEEFRRQTEKLSSSLFLWNVFFYFPEAELSCDSLCKIRESFYMLLRPCLLISGMNLPKDTLFGFVFLKLSRIIIICFATTSPPLITPTYSKGGKRPLRYLWVTDYSWESSNWRLFLSLSVLVTSGSSIKNWNIKKKKKRKGTFRENKPLWQ